ncbi:hypothetical protein IMCC1989_575 [gamma proteobacterium IMCC1989]|nr:hypothetical protein IMCC1989_575 [gamma proteobacterium IMCC1989]
MATGPPLPASVSGLTTYTTPTLDGQTIEAVFNNVIDQATHLFEGQ